MQSLDFKKLLPHILIIVGFAIFSFIYAYPVLQGKVLIQHDLMNWEAMYQQIKTYHDSTGINVLWTNSMFGGMPTYTLGVPESNNYLGHLYNALLSFPKPASYFFITLLCFYVLMVVMKINRWLSIIGAFAYSFATYTIILTVVGHETKIIAMAYLPAVLAGLILIYRRKWIVGALLMVLTLSFMIGTAHYQVLYYSLFVFIGYAIVKFVESLKQPNGLKDFLLSSSIAIAMALVAIGTSMVAILPIQEYAKTTMRGGESELTINKNPDQKAGGLDKDYAFNWSNGIGETFCLMIPYLYGGSLNEPIEKAPETDALTGGRIQGAPLYWGPQNSGISGPVYFGAIICFLFVLGILVIKSPHKWWIIAVCAITIMMSWGSNFKALNYFLFDNLPLYNKFRTPSMILIIPQLLFPILGMWGLMTIIEGKISNEALIKKIKIAAGATAGICILFAFAGGMFFDYSNKVIDSQFPQQLLEPLKEDRQSLATKSSLISAFYILAAAGLLWAFAKKKINQNILIGCIGALIFIDLISVANNYLSENDYEDDFIKESAFTPRPVDQEILKDKDPYYRVLDLSRNVYNDAIPAYYHKNVGGYSPAKMEIYQDLIDMQMGGAQTGGKFNKEVLNMLNTKYIIFNGPNQQPNYQINPEANGNAWFVNDVKIVKTADEEMTSLNAQAIGDTTVVPNAFNSKTTAIIRDDYAKGLSGYAFGKDSTASIQLTKYGMNDLSFVSNNTQDGLAVFSDIWYPYGWEATIDGKPVEIMRANYVLRALKVPAGKHTIEFHFRPQTFELGNRLTLYSNIIIGLVILIALYFLFTNKKIATTTEDTVM